MRSQQRNMKAERALKKFQSSSFVFLEDKYRKTLESEFEAKVQTEFFRNAKGASFSTSVNNVWSSRKLEATRTYLKDSWNELKTQNQVFSTDILVISESESETASASEDDGITIEQYPPLTGLTTNIQELSIQRDKLKETTVRSKKSLTDFEMIRIDRLLDIKAETLTSIVKDQKDNLYDLFPKIEPKFAELGLNISYMASVECSLSVDCHLASKLGQICKDMAYNKMTNQDDCQYYFLVTNGDKEIFTDMQKRLEEILSSLQKPEWSNANDQDRQKRRLYDSVILTKRIASKENFKVFMCWHEFDEYHTKGDFKAIRDYIIDLEQEIDNKKDLTKKVNEMEAAIKNLEQEAIKNKESTEAKFAEMQKILDELLKQQSTYGKMRGSFERAF